MIARNKKILCVRYCSLRRMSVSLVALSCHPREQLPRAYFCSVQVVKSSGGVREDETSEVREMVRNSRTMCGLGWLVDTRNIAGASGPAGFG